jgi:NAD dependent epimerase/dehydratase family enzyme
MIQRVIDEMQALCSRAIVVAGYKKERILELTKGYANLEAVFNTRCREGMKMNKTIIISGATGFIGEALARFFLTKNYRVKGLTRNPAKVGKLKVKGIEPVPWAAHSFTGWEKELEGADALINLSGENIGSGRWSGPKKDKILNSRTAAGKIITGALSRLDQKPAVYLQASAVGYYGSQDCRGIFNLTEPHPVRNREFSRTLGKVLHRPSFLPVPSFVLKILLGEMAEQLLLSSQRVLPKRLKEAGFTFQYPHLEEALVDLLE